LGGCRDYLDPVEFQQAGVQIQWQNFVHPQYTQRPRAENFIPGLSAIDLLFNCGPESGKILQGRTLEYAANA
jgi:hypothetical protein